MAEERKSDYLGDRFGDWEVTEKAPAQGDRIRRWVVTNAEGVQMTVAQTGLKDLALAKTLKDRAAEHDAAKPLSRQISESVLLANALHREAVASVALDNDPECGTYSLDDLNPFADMTPDVVETEDVIVQSDNPFELSFEEVVGDIEIEGSDEFVATWVAPREETEPETSQQPIGIHVTAAMDFVVKAKVQLNSALKALEDLL